MHERLGGIIAKTFPIRFPSRVPWSFAIQPPWLPGDPEPANLWGGNQWQWAVKAPARIKTIRDVLAPCPRLTPPGARRYFATDGGEIARGRSPSSGRDFLTNPQVSGIIRRLTVTFPLYLSVAMDMGPVLEMRIL